MINDLVGKEIAGRYRVGSLLRETELGDFYHGSNLVTGTPVLVKLLAPAMAIDQRYVDRFLEEMNGAASVSHQNILSILDVGTDTHVLPFAIFEAPEGISLREMIAAEGQLQQEAVIGIAGQIAAALASAHSANLIHGGLNPDKVFVKRQDTGLIVKVFDFGIRPHAGNSLATASYLAPEQTGVMPVSDARSDIYALGTIAYELAAGETPFADCKTPAEIRRRQQNDPPPPLTAFRNDLHAQFEPIVLSTIVADPDRRYQLMSDVEEDLKHLGSETGVVFTPMMEIPSEPPAKRNVWQTAFIVLLGIALLSAALIYATSTRQTNPTASLAPDANSSPVQPINPATGAQEEAMLKLGDVGDASLVPNANLELPPGTLPGGDGYNPWANGGIPPAGAPLTSGPLAGSQVPNQPPALSVPPGGQTVTINPNGGSVFMPNEGGVILVPIPANAVPQTKPSPTPKMPANTAVKTPETKPATAKTPAAKPDTVKPSKGAAKDKNVGQDM